MHAAYFVLSNFNLTVELIFSDGVFLVNFNLSLRPQTIYVGVYLKRES